MIRRIPSMFLLAALCGSPILVGCDKTVSKETTTERKSDGTTTSQEKKTTQSPDGTVKTTEKTNNP